MSKKNRRQDIVFSTNPDFDYDAGYEDEETLPPQQQQLKVQREKKGRGGKEVSIVRNFVGSNDDLKDLAKMLKQSCGVGGNVKDKEIIIQGNQVDKIIELLINAGYKAKKSGG